MSLFARFCVIFPPNHLMHIYLLVELYHSQLVTLVPYKIQYSPSESHSYNLAMLHQILKNIQNLELPLLMVVGQSYNAAPSSS